MGVCVNCAYKGTCTLASYYEAQGEHIVKCGNRKPITNADRVRAMTDEELAYELSDVGCPATLTTCPYDDCDGQPSDEMCQKCWLDWLRQEATNG